MPTRGKRLTLIIASVAVLVLGVATWQAWPHIVFWSRFESLGPNAQGYPEYRHRQTGIVFVQLPGGTFWMGAQKDDPEGHNFDPHAEPREGPVHAVTLSPFLIGKYEVTQAQWTHAVGYNPSGFHLPHGIGSGDLPVEAVSWDEIQSFEERTGLVLPTEAQWEYICRAGTTTPFAFGETLTPQQANWGDEPVVVTAYEPSPFGIHQTHGNIIEWCEDVFDESFYGTIQARESDPQCRSGSEYRTIRGGSIGCKASDCRSAARGRAGPDELANNFGFRVTYWPLP